MLDSDTYRLGLGTYSLTGEEGIDAIVAAIEAGYRHLDTARLYGNEEEVGAAIERASVDRDDLFVATKIAHFEEPGPTPEHVRTGVDESRAKLDCDTIDLLYHHWPRGTEDIETVLPVFEDLLDEGIVERVAVSNYTIEDITHARNLVDVPLFANQVEMHPLLQQDDLYEYLREQDMYAVAYSPLAQGEVFEVPELRNIAEKHDTTPANVSLAWLRSRDGVVPIPRSSSKEHICANFRARELTLDDEDRERIAAIDGTLRCENPDWMEW